MNQFPLHKDQKITPKLGRKINSFDASVTTQYNHGIPGALKNAIEQLTVCQILGPDYCLMIEPIGHYKNKKQKRLKG